MKMEDGSGVAVGIICMLILFLSIWGSWSEGYSTACSDALDDPRHFIKSALKRYPEKALELERESKPSVEIQ